MNIFQRYKKLSFWNKTGFLGAIASIIALVYTFTKKEDINNISVNNSPNTTIQNMVNSPNSTQIQNKENININLNSSSKPRKLVEKSKIILLDVINQNPQKEILIHVILGDQEAHNYAMQTKEFIESKTGKNVELKWCVFAKPFKGQKIYENLDKQILIEIGNK